MGHAEDAKHFRVGARALLGSMFRAAADGGTSHPDIVDSAVEYLEAAAVAAVMHRLRTRLETMTVDGPARAALEQLLSEEGT